MPRYQGEIDDRVDAVVQSLLDGFPRPLAYLDRGLNYVRVNPAYAEAYRRPPQDFIGRGLFELYPRAENEAAFRRVRDVGEPAVLRTQPFVFPDQPARGVTYWDATLSPIKGKSGTVTGLLLALTDVTGEVAARARSSLCRSMVDFSEDAIVLLSPDWKIEIWNAGARGLYGFSEEEALGAGIHALLRSVGPEPWPAIEARVRESGRWEGELQQTTRDGRQVAVMARLGLLRGDGGQSSIVESNRDITGRKRAEDALRESEARYRALFAESRDAIYLADTETGILIDANAEAERLVGRSREELVGKHHTVLHPPEALEHYRGVFAKHVREGGTRPIELEMQAKDGRRIPASLATALIDFGGRRILQGVFRDITDRKRVEEALRASEERFRTMADSAPLVIWVTDASGTNQFVNRAYCEFFGTTLEAVKAAGWRQFIHAEDEPAFVAAFLAALGERRPFHASARMRRADGRWRWVEAFGQPSSSPSGGFVGIAVDITERRQAEEALREVDRRKDEFLAILSHELRNPLMPIRNSLHVMEKAPPGSALARKAQAIIDRQVTQLTRLVDDLLDATRIGRGKVMLHMERLELGELVRRTVEDHRMIFQAGGLTLDVSLTTRPLWLEGDPTRLAQVVGNLLNNAAKFTPAGGRVSVRLAAEHGTAMLRVRDTGIGIAADRIGNVFEAFMQVEQALDRKRGGLGLGLALVKGLAELHGGTVEAASEGLGRGATFTVRLPVQPAIAAEPAAAPTAAPMPMPRRRILIVEDDPDAAESLRQVLELHGHEVAVAYTGSEGIEMARRFVPEVVLCDLGLPDTDGYAVGRVLRADETLREAFLVALTGYALPEDIARAAEAGFDRHLAKPPSAEKLEKVLAEACGRTPH